MHVPDTGSIQPIAVTTVNKLSSEVVRRILFAIDFVSGGGVGFVEELLISDLTECNSSP